jgi:hypothetical protein
VIVWKVLASMVATFVALALIALGLLHLAFPGGVPTPLVVLSGLVVALLAAGISQWSEVTWRERDR